MVWGKGALDGVLGVLCACVFVLHVCPYAHAGEHPSSVAANVVSCVLAHMVL